MICLSRQTKNTKTRGFSNMRVTRVAQASIFEIYSEHEFGVQLKALSDILDQYPAILTLVAKDLIDDTVSGTGRQGLSVENVFRCIILKQLLNISYRKLSFHLSDSVTYRAFTRLPHDIYPSDSGLQAVMRKISPETLEKVHELILKKWVENRTISVDKLRVDSTVVASNIAPPSDSQLLNDSIRVLSRLLAKSQLATGIKFRFHDQRKRAKSLAFSIFNAKKAEKEALYPQMLHTAGTVLQQVDRALETISVGRKDLRANKWLNELIHYKTLLLKVIDQTTRRVIHKEKVPSLEKVVSIFEPHTDIIVKGFRDTQYGHKINLSSEVNGFITAFSIEEGNPSDKELWLPVVEYHQQLLNQIPETIIGDGCYASKSNVEESKSLGVKRVVFSKPVGLSLHDMGIKKKTLEKLRHFRAGVEGNISELKRAFGATKATWKGLDGFKAYVWSSVISYNLTRLARLNSG